MRKLDSRRAIDVAVGAAGLAFLGLPIIAMAAIARMESGKSGIFLQTRYGLHGKPFTIYKIRSLDADANLLRISGVFRKFGLDELPQFFNLIKGDMSMIGPRPNTSIADIPEYVRTLDIPPGLTGLNAVIEKTNGVEHSATERARIENKYVDLRLSSRSSLPLDMFIIFKTAKIVLTGRADAGKYGKPRVPLDSTPSHISESTKLDYQ